MPDPWHIVTVGRGNDGKVFRELSRGVPRLSVNDADPGTGDVLNAFDLLLVPSRYESFGLIIAEGLRVGIPILSTPTGIARIAPGMTREIPIGAAADVWAKAILESWQVKPGRYARVTKGLRFAQERLTLSRFGSEWTDAITSLVKPEAQQVKPRRMKLTDAVRLGIVKDRFSVRENCNSGKEK